MERKKLTQEQEAGIYCIRNGHANYVWKFWGYVHCGRCGKQIGDQLGSMFDTTGLLVIGCKDKPCKVCDPLKKKLSKMDKKIFMRLQRAKGHFNYEKILQGIKWEASQ